MKKGTLAIGISCSGRTRETVTCLQVARENKATTMCLTNSMKSPITELCDVVLCATPAEVKYFQAPLASRVTQLALIDALFVSVASRNKREVAAHLQRSGERLLQQRITRR
jgi:DNA-binding MurR/RpiR family transcriptional regulator